VDVVKTTLTEVQVISSKEDKTSNRNVKTHYYHDGGLRGIGDRLTVGARTQEGVTCVPVSESRSRLE
jgi:hypothetical protein